MARPEHERGAGPVRRLDARDPGAAEKTASHGPLIQLATRCVSVDDFVARFAPFVSDDTVAIPVASALPIGSEARFMIRLNDQSVVMRGRCRVAEVKAVGGGSNRVMMRVQLVETDEETRRVHARLLAHRQRNEAPPHLPAPSPAAPAAAPPVAPVAAPPPKRSPTRPMVVAPPRPTLNAAPPPPPPLTLPAPPVSATGPTMIATPAPPPAAAANGTVATAIATDATEPSRTPGSDYKLPANPLSGLGAEDLSSFVESTLFEAGESEPADGVAAADASRPVMMGGETERLDMRPAAGRRHRLSPQARRILVGALPYVVCTVIGVLAGQALRSRPAAAPTPAPATAAARATPPAPTAAPPPVPAPPAVPVVAAPASPVARPLTPTPSPQAGRGAHDRPPPPAAGGCVADVVTEPDGARVVWGKRALGTSPLERVVVPCGEETVSITHERYRPVVRKVLVEPGAAARVSERLRRPPATLVLSSSPARAHFTVNDQDVGAAPRKLNVWRFETVRVKATLAGYEPWSKTLYLREPITKLNAQLAGQHRGPLGGRLSR